MSKDTLAPRTTKTRFGYRNHIIQGCKKPKFLKTPLKLSSFSPKAVYPSIAECFLDYIPIHLFRKYFFRQATTNVLIMGDRPLLLVFLHCRNLMFTVTAKTFFSMTKKRAAKPTTKINEVQHFQTLFRDLFVDTT